MMFFVRLRIMSPFTQHFSICRFRSFLYNAAICFCMPHHWFTVRQVSCSLLPDRKVSEKVRWYNFCVGKRIRFMQMIPYEFRWIPQWDFEEIRF